MRCTRDDRGFALAVAIMALVVIGALVAGAFFVGMQEQRVGRNTMKLQQAFAAADGGAQLQIAQWNAGVYNRLAMAGTLAESTAAFGGWLEDSTGWYRGTVRRFNRLMFLVTSEGFSRDSTARQRLGLLVRLRPVEINIRAGVETQGRIEVAGNAVISGRDTLPQLWPGCPVPSDSVAGLRIAETDSIEYQGNQCQTGGCVKGDPPEEEDAAINDSTLTHFGDLTFQDLSTFATIVLPGNTSGSPYRVQPSKVGAACNTADVYNWGEPKVTSVGVPGSAPYTPECDAYFPIVYIDGDAWLNQQRGQGLLIVNGDLHVAGLTELYGPVVVHGRLVAEGGGNQVPHFYGGVIVAGQTAANESRVAGNAIIYYSSCALERALVNSAPGALVRERGWANLY